MSKTAGAMLPSPSVLTGNFQPQTAAAFVEQCIAEAKARAAGSRLGTPSVHQRASVDEVNALCNLASRHLGAIRHAPPSPYHVQLYPPRSISTPPLRTSQQPQSQSQPQSQPQQPSAEPWDGAAATASWVESHASKVALVGPGSGAAATASTVAPGAPLSRPGTSMQGRVGSGASLRARTPLLPDAPPSGSMQAAAAASGNATAGAGAADAAQPKEGTQRDGVLAAGRPDTQLQQQQPPLTSTLPPLIIPSAPSADEPAAAGSAAPAAASSPHRSPTTTAAATAAASATAARASPPALPSSPQGPTSRLGPHHAGPIGPRPTTSLSVQDLTLPKPGVRLPGMGGNNSNASSGHATGAPSGGGGGCSTPHRMDLSSAPCSGGGSLPSTPYHSSGGGVASILGGESPRGSMASRGSSRFSHTATRWRAQSVDAMSGAGGGGGSRGGEGGRLGSCSFKVSPGMVYSVFQELDEYDTGRLTYSAFEQAACRVGLRPAQAKRFYKLLDPNDRGFATVREWGSPQLQRQMEAFTRLYVQNTRGKDGRPKDATEIKSMHMAIQMALLKLQLRRCGRPVSLDRLVQAFAYMDKDSSGALSAEEVEDALNSLGVFVTKEVMETIMRTFDKNNSGGVDYYEFVKALYPTLDQAYQH
ncbi:hypothetical protein Agub_g14595 [Astrephomene gubernaculifera]|uniref:EF-hand domain-containing protein n=1 Tax=Astrephomene gubernaculifera TaxID=47775 RepID=A0AAD3HTA5_9CHLO|nr:hypothetical protein Agub_g14595 [Astrephomene gubernaculifera]